MTTPSRSRRSVDCRVRQFRADGGFCCLRDHPGFHMTLGAAHGPAHCKGCLRLVGRGSNSLSTVAHRAHGRWTLPCARLGSAAFASVASSVAWVVCLRLLPCLVPPRRGARVARRLARLRAGSMAFACWQHDHGGRSALTCVRRLRGCHGMGLHAFEISLVSGSDQAARPSQPAALHPRVMREGHHIAWRQRRAGHLNPRPAPACLSLPCSRVQMPGLAHSGAMRLAAARGRAALMNSHV